MAAEVVVGVQEDRIEIELARMCGAAAACNKVARIAFDLRKRFKEVDPGLSIPEKEAALYSDARRVRACLRDAACLMRSVGLQAQYDPCNFEEADEQAKD